MIYRVLIKFNQNLNKNQDLNEHKLLTFNLLDVNKDQLFIHETKIRLKPETKGPLSSLFPQLTSFKNQKAAHLDILRKQCLYLLLVLPPSAGPEGHLY